MRKHPIPSLTEAELAHLTGDFASMALKVHWAKRLEGHAFVYFEIAHVLSLDPLRLTWTDRFTCATCGVRSCGLLEAWSRFMADEWFSRAQELLKLPNPDGSHAAIVKRVLTWAKDEDPMALSPQATDETESAESPDHCFQALVECTCGTEGFRESRIFFFNGARGLRRP